MMSTAGDPHRDPYPRAQRTAAATTRSSLTSGTTSPRSSVYATRFALGGSWCGWMWITNNIPAGTQWEDRITRGIEACKAFIFVISEGSKDFVRL